MTINIGSRKSNNNIVPVTGLPVITATTDISASLGESGFGTTPTIDAYYHRVGEFMRLRGSIKLGSSTISGHYAISIPASLNANTAKMKLSPGGATAYRQVDGVCQFTDSGAAPAIGYTGIAVLNNSSTTQMLFVGGDSSSDQANFWGGTNNKPVVPAASADAFHFELEIPILEWADDGVTGATDASLYVDEATGTTAGVIKLSNSSVVIDTPTGHGSSGTKVRTFTSGNVTTIGTDITYASDTTNGDTFTVNTAGVYAISYSDSRAATTATIGISLNATTTTTVWSLVQANLLGYTETGAAVTGQVSTTVRLSATDIIRAHDDGNADGTAVYHQFRIEKISN